MSTSIPKGGPKGYKELAKYLPEAKDRAKALGVTKLTISKWDADPTAAVTKKHETVCDLMLWTAKELDAIVGSELPVRDLLVMPQPMFDSRVPAEDIRMFGAGSAEMYVQAIAAVQEVKSRNLREICADKELWQRVHDGLSDEAKARQPQTVKAIKEYRKKHGKLSLLD